MARKRVKCELAAVFGPEPSFEGVKVTKANYNSVLIPALQWYGQYGGANNTNSLRAFHKSWLKEWALANGFKRGSFTIPNQGIGTLGSVARCALRGFKLAKRDVDRLKEALNGWAPVPKKTVDHKAQSKMLKLKAKIKNDNELSPFFTLFDSAIDEVFAGAKKWDVKTTDSLNATQKKELTAHYKESLAEFKALHDESDAELTAGYRKLPKLTRRRLVQLHKDILEEIAEAGVRGTVLRKATKVRRKKAKPASAVIKKLQYLPVHDGYGLHSFDPEKLVGASTAFVFDTKKRLLKRYDAKGVAGIEVTGTTLKNVVGVSKKIRKPELQLKGFDKLPVTKCNATFNSTKALEKECTGRTNRETILLRVFK